MSAEAAAKHPHYANPSWCPAYGLGPHTYLTFRVAYLMEQGQIDLDDIDLWYLEAVECYRDANTRHLMSQDHG